MKYIIQTRAAKLLKITTVVIIITLLLLTLANQAHAASPTPTQSRAAINIITAFGYKCSSVDSIRFWLTGGNGYTVHCNSYRYKYYIQDKGGIIHVTAQ